MKKHLIYLSIIFSSFYFSGCSNYFHKKANNEFVNLQFSDAIKDYNKVLLKEDNHEAKIKLANCYRLTNDVEKAGPLYAEIVNYPESKAINTFHYAKILMSLGDYDNAKKWYKNYLDLVPDDAVAQISLATCNSVNPFIRDTTLFSLNLVNFPCFESSFGSAPYKDGVVFTANKKPTLNTRTDPWTGKSFYDIYFAEKDKDGNWLSPQLLKGEINGRYHEGPAAFNKGEDIAYFTRSNYYKKKLRKSASDENNLKIFKAKLVNDKWEELEEMPFNSDEYSVGHPCLSRDEKTLYFISDMPGGLGGTDIYKSIYDGEAWGKPENLGNAINTSGNEMFPFMSHDGTLYFSSDSHTNMGGLDVFATSYDEKNKKWQQVENLNYPLNSTKDDFAFVLNEDEKTGFVSSNRNSPDKIYEFEKHDPTFNLFGIFSVKGEKTAIESATLTIINITNNAEKITVETDKNGFYKINLKRGTEYLVQGSKENYFTQSAEISTNGKKYSEEFERNFELDKIVIERPIVVGNTYYDLDKWDIRPDAELELDKLVSLFTINPTISVEIGSHTDSRGGDNYNMILSDKRAKAIVEYLVLNGIDANRLIWKGYGETELINKCNNDTECAEEEHQQNRRTEFKVIKK
ncbi:MAG: OmpA family protein [Bacteroidota bacterium]